MQRRNGSSLATLLALRDLATHDSPITVDAILVELKGDRLERFREARHVLQGFHEPETLRQIVTEGIGHSLPQVRAQVILAMGNGRPQGIDWISPTEAALNDPKPEVRAAAVEALGLARAGERLDRILELSADPSVRVRQRIPEALVRLAPQRALALLRTMASDPSWRVRVSVARALGALHTRASVEALIDLLEQESGRVREDTLTELKRLVRQNFGLHVDAWRRFLETAPAGFLSTKSKESLTSLSDLGSVVYYGLASLSTRFVLVTDLSGSMTSQEFVGSRTPISGTRLELTKQKIEALLNKVDKDVSVNLITFSDKAHTWRRSLLPMTAKGKAKAKAEVRSYRADGATNLFDALGLCFEMAEESLDAPRREDDAPDTIFLLTDGEPSEGELRDPGLILEYVTEKNRDLQLRIHCIMLNTSAASTEFMSRLARETTGEFVNPFD
jgi:Mg-chelatase subunit ChlD